MLSPDRRSPLENYAGPLYGAILGVIGLLIGELAMGGESWPWFVGLVTGSLIGFAVSTRLRRQREARESSNNRAGRVS